MNFFSNIKIVLLNIVLVIIIAIFSNSMLLAVPTNNKLSFIDTNAINFNNTNLIDHVYDSLDYLPNVILIKTKKMSPINKLNNITLEYSISSKFEKLGLSIRQTRAPFAKYYYQNGVMCSASEQGIERICEILLDSNNTNYNIFEICRELMEDENIEYAEPAPVRKAYSFIPNDPLKGNQWYLSAIGAYDAWEVVKDKTGVLIGIVDSGTDIKHEDLKSNIWKNPNEIIDALDNDNNGKIDDINGWDFVGGATIQDISSGKYKEDNDPSPKSSGNFHGTHVAGCAAAVVNNNIGVTGIGINCQIVATKHSVDNDQATGIFRGYEGIVYLAKLGARVINCSWGGSRFSFAELDAINEALELGAVIFAASGNEYKDNDIIASYPACYNGVISIGAISSSGGKANFSNYGYSTLLNSYGSKIYSTLPFNTYNNLDGTSMASPIAAGVAGLVLSVFPDYNYKQVYHQMRSTGRQIYLSDSQDTFKYANRIIASNAVKYNNPDFPDLVVPGIEVSSYDLPPFNKFTTTSQKKLTLRLKNYIGQAENLQILVTSIDNYVLFSGNKNAIEFSVGKMNILEEKEITMNVKLNSFAMFAEGSAALLIKYSDGDFSDYEVIYIPISIPTTNSISRNVLYGAHDNGYPVVNYGTLINYNTSASYLVRSFYDSYNIFRTVLDVVPHNSEYSNMQYFTTPQQSVPYAMSVISPTHFVIGSSTSSKAFILHTKDLFSTAARYLEVTGITSFINYITFFDDNNGILVGDPAAGSRTWGVATTSDGGTTWKAISGASVLPSNNIIPDAMPGENGLLNVAARYKNNIWFGTTHGRILFSSDRGASWSIDTINLGSSIIAINFINSTTGMVLYNNAGNYILATTTDNKNWTKNISNLSSFTKAKPQSIYSDDYGVFYIIFNNNAILATSDLGKSWKMLPSKELANSMYTSVISTADKKTLLFKTLGASSQYNSTSANFNCSYYTITSTKVEVPVSNSECSITAIPQSELRYGSIELGKDSLRYILIKNTGSQTVILTNLTILPQNSETTMSDFTIVRYNLSIAPGDSGRVYIRFTPKTSGEKQAIIYISNNTDKHPELGFRLIGSGLFIPFSELKTNKSKLMWEYASEDDFIPELALNLTNIGNAPLTISETRIVSTNQNTLDTDFEVVDLQLPLEIEAGKTEKIKVKFAGNFLEDIYRSADLILYNSGVTPEDTIKLVFNASGAISHKYEYNYNYNIFNIHDQVVSKSNNNKCELIINLEENSSKYSIKLYDANGYSFGTVFAGTGDIGENKFIINTSNLPIGSYYLLLELDNMCLYNKFVVVR